MPPSYRVRPRKAARVGLCRASLDGSRQEAPGEGLLTEGKKLEGKGREGGQWPAPFFSAPYLILFPFYYWDAWRQVPLLVTITLGVPGGQFAPNTPNV